MDSLVEKFIQSTFGYDIFKFEARVSKLERMQLINSMMMIVFSHRYSKGDSFIQEATQSTKAD